MTAVRAPERPAARDSATLVICCCALFMVSLDNTILNVALPAMQQGLDTPVTGLQWTVDAYILVRGVMLFASGSAGDRHGRRRLFRTGLWVFTLASVACSLAPSLGALIAFRCVQAVGGALMTPSSLAIVTNTFTDPGRRAKAIGFWSATNGLSTAAGPVLGGLLVETFGWRSVFWVNLPVGIAVLAATRWLRESRADQPRPQDPAGQLLLAASLGALTYALIEAPHAGWTSPQVAGLVVLSVVLGAVFVEVERSRQYPMLPLRYLRNPGLAGAVVLALTSFVLLGGFTFFNTLYLQDVRGYSPVMCGVLMLPTTVATLVFSPLSGRLTGSRGSRLPALLAMALIAAGSFLLAAVIAPGTSLPALLVAYLLLGTGMGLGNTPATNAAVSSMPRSLAGVASATTSTARQVGTSTGVALLGSLIFSVPGSAPDAAAGAAFSTGLAHAYLLVAVLAVGTGAFAWWAFRPGARWAEHE